MLLKMVCWKILRNKAAIARMKKTRAFVLASLEAWSL